MSASLHLGRPRGAAELAARPGLAQRACREGQIHTRAATVDLTRFAEATTMRSRTCGAVWGLAQLSACSRPLSAAPWRRLDAPAGGEEAGKE